MQYRHPSPHPVVVYRSNAGRAIQVVGTRGVPLPVHNIIVAVEQTIPDLQKKWTRFGDNRRVYAISVIISNGLNCYEKSLVYVKKKLPQ